LGATGVVRGGGGVRVLAGCGPGRGSGTGRREGWTDGKDGWRLGQWEDVDYMAPTMGTHRLRL